MLDDNAIRSLLEMGITRDVAQDALKRANGDLEAAVSFIFSNELPPGISENVIEDYSRHESPFLGSAEHVELDSSNSAGFKPGDLSDVITTTRTEQIISTDSDVDVDADLDTGNVATNGAIVENSLYTSDDSQSVLENVMDCSCQKVQISDPTIVLPLPPNFLFENYFALFSLCVSTYLPHLLAKPDFKDLNYDKDWYKGNALQSPTHRIEFIKTETGKDDEVKIVPAGELSEQDSRLMLQPELLWQLQKLTSVVNSQISDRAYVRAKSFSLALEPQVQRKLADSEHLYEVLPSFIKSLAVDLEMCPNIDDNDIRKLFISSAFHTPSNNEPTIKTWLSLFHFLPEEYDSNLYRMFNVLLYPDDSASDSDERRSYGNGADENETENQNNKNENENENSLSDVAPILTIVFDEMDEATEPISLAEGVEVPLEFYPQLYTKNCKDKLIRHIISKRKQSQLQSRSILQDINNLKSFQGKDLLKFINSSLDYLQKDGASEDIIKRLHELKDNITAQKIKKMNEYKRLAQQLHGEWNLGHPDIQIVKTAKSLGLIDEPYHLVMAAISPYFYYTRSRSGQWNFVQCKPSGTDFQVRACSSPHEVQDTIKQRTREPSEVPLMFIYCKESIIPDDDVVRKALEMNQGCTKFAKDDQLNLITSNTLGSSRETSLHIHEPTDAYLEPSEGENL